MQRLLKALLAGTLLLIGVVGISAPRPAAADTCTIGGACGSDVCDIAGATCPDTSVGIVSLDTASDGHGLNAQCTARGTASTSSVTYAIAGDTTATGGVALSTGIECRIYTNSGYWGRAIGGAAGPAAAAAGTSYSIPLSQLAGLRVCAYGSTTYHPTDYRRTAVSYGCQPW